MRSFKSVPHTVRSGGVNQLEQRRARRVRMGGAEEDAAATAKHR